MASKRDDGGSGNDWIVITVPGGDGRTKRIERAAATAYFRGEPLRGTPHRVFLNSFLRSAENHPDERVRIQYAQIKAAVTYAPPDDATEDDQ